MSILKNLNLDYKTTIRNWFQDHVEVYTHNGMYGYDKLNYQFNDIFKIKEQNGEYIVSTMPWGSSFLNDSQRLMICFKDTTSINHDNYFSWGKIRYVFNLSHFNSLPLLLDKETRIFHDLPKVCSTLIIDDISIGNLEDKVDIEKAFLNVDIRNKLIITHEKEDSLCMNFSEYTVSRFTFQGNMCIDFQKERSRLYDYVKHDKKIF